MSLRFYATGSMQRVIGDVSGMCCIRKPNEGTPVIAGILTYPLKTGFTAFLCLNIISKQRQGESILSILNTWNKNIYDFTY